MDKKKELTYIDGLIDGIKVGLHSLKAYIEQGFKMEELDWDNIESLVILAVLESAVEESKGGEDE